MTFNARAASLALLAVAAQADARNELVREEVWNDAHVRRDAEALGRLWADDLIVTVPGWRVIAFHASVPE